MRVRRFFFVIPLFLAVCLTGLVLPQGRTANIAGVVTDSTGGVLPGVEVTVRNVDTGITQDLLSDDEGRYQVRNLVLGNYEVEASLAGFQISVRSGITLTVGRSAVVDLTLQIGAITERVVVTGDAPLINTTSAELSGLVDAKKIRDLPLNGRSFDQLAQLQPGVVSFRQTGFGSGRISVGGARPTQTNWVIDGTSIMDDQRGTPGSGITRTNFGVEAIREFEVLSSTYSAIFGGAAGGVVNIVSRSGTNELHGSVYEFHRNDNLDARNFFDVGDPGEFKRNQFGFALGGPIVKDRTFIFGNYEGLRERVAATDISSVPTVAARQGILPKPSSGSCPSGFPEDPASGNCVGVASPLSAPYLALYPLPNGRDFGDGTAEFITAQSEATDEDYYTVRFDHQISDSDSIFVRYAITDSSQVSPGAFLLFGRQPVSRIQYVTIEEKKIFSPTLLNTVRIGFNRNYDKSDGEDLVSIDPSLSFVPGQPFGRLSLAFGGIAGAVDSLQRPTLSYDAFQMTQIMDDVNYTRGAHSFQFGGTFGRLQHNFTNARNQRGLYSYDSLEDIILARDATEFRAYALDSNVFRGMRLSTLGLYVQDDFQVGPSLTLNLGLRYQTQSGPSEVNGLQSAVRDTDSGKAIAGEPYYDKPPHAFEPRLGFAWDPFGNGKTSFRGGFGIFHDFVLGNIYVNTAVNDSLFTKTVSLTPAPFPNAFDVISQATEPALSNLTSTNTNLNMSSRMQWNLSIQQEILPNTVALVAYSGALGRHGTRTAEANAAFPDILPDGRKFFPAGRDSAGVACDPADPAAPATCEDFKRRNPNFGSILRHSKDANSEYNSLQLMVNRRFAQGFQLQGSYTWSHSTDENSQQWGSHGRNNPQNAVDTDDVEFDRGPSIFDIRHNFTFNATYDLPFLQSQSTPVGKILGGWQLNTLITISSGFTVTPIVGFNQSRNFDLRRPERPNLASGRSNNPVLGGPDQYFDPTAFELPDPGFFGDLGRGTLRGPGFNNVDFGLVKMTRVSENVDVQFRAEFFNLLNRANFGRPRATIFTSKGRSGSAGRITSTLGIERQIQLGLKIIF